MGKNTLIVRGLSGGREVATVKAEFFYRSSDDPAAVVPRGYRPFLLHTSEKEALCTPCHEMKPTMAQLKGAMAESNPCASCHKRMLNRKFVHGPEGVFQCVDCHDSASRPHRWQVTKPELTLCGECHTDKIDEFNRNAFVHGPVATGDCTLCHDPHAADEPAQLHAQVNRLCLGCHSNIKEGDHVIRGISGKAHPLGRGKDPSRPGQNMSCVSCHNPHGGAVQAFFRSQITGRFTLCQLCHKK